MSGSRLNPYLSPASQQVSERDAETLPKTSVLLMLLLTVVTLGFYVPVWFLRRRKPLNALGGDVSVWPFVAAIAMMVIMTGLRIMAPTPGDGLARILNVVVGIILLVQSFSVKSIFESSFGRDRERELLLVEPKLSGVLTFIGTVFYLQFKINRMDQIELRTPPFGSRLLVWGGAAAGFVVMVVVGALIESMRGLDVYVEQVRANLQRNAVVEEHIGDIDNLEVDWVASDAETGENVFVLDISGDKGAGRLTAEIDQTMVSSGTLRMSSGENYELVPGQ